MSIRNNKDDEHRTPHEEMLDAVIEQRDNNPLPGQESEDELWLEANKMMVGFHSEEKKLQELRKHFTIKRK